MGLRLRRSLRLAPGIRVNLSKTGASLSVGRRGATVNFSGRGTRTTVGLPGTGISYSSTARPGSNGAGPVITAVCVAIIVLALVALAL